MKNYRTNDLIYDVLGRSEAEKKRAESLWQQAGKPYKKGFLDELKKMALDGWILSKTIKKTVYYWKPFRTELKKNFVYQRQRANASWYVDMLIEHFWFDKLAEDHRDLFGIYDYVPKGNIARLVTPKEDILHPAVQMLIMPIFYQFYDLNLALQNRIRVSLDTKQVKPYEVEPILKDCQKDVQKVINEILKGHEFYRQQFLEYIADHYRTRDLFV